MQDSNLFFCFILFFRNFFLSLSFDLKYLFLFFIFSLSNQFFISLFYILIFFIFILLKILFFQFLLLKKSLKIRLQTLDRIGHLLWIKIFEHILMIIMLRLALRANESFFLVAKIFDSLLIMYITKILMLILFGTFIYI